MNIHTYHCLSTEKCCEIMIREYNKEYTHRYSYRKAGVFIYDPQDDSVLLVQSRGHLFGCPKGSIKKGETDIECAIREVKEETGIIITPDKLDRFIKIKNKAVYYYLEMPKCKVEIQNNQGEDSNDANGITWIKIKCLEQAIENGNITLNHYAKIVFSKFLCKIFPRTDWTQVTKTK
jgi:ADP-ribose pyrophosphatase YjhB (NUDIX family)